MTKNEAWLGAVAEFSLCALIFALPFSKSMVEIFFSCALVSWVIGKQARRYKERGGLINVFRPRGSPLNMPICLFIFAALLSTLGSASFFLSIKGFFFKMLEWVLLYFIVIDVIDSRAKLNRILAVMALSMAIVGADGIYQFVAGVDFLRGYSSDGGRVIQGPFTVRNSFAGWLVVMIPLAVSLVYAVRDKARKISAFFLAGILALCLVLTYSRGAIMAVLLGLVFFAFFNRRKYLLIAAALLLASSPVFLNVMKMRITSMAMIPGYDRLGLWQEALAIIEDFPLFGCGLNTYAAVGPLYRVAGGGGCYPHNSYLQMAAELGLFGLGAFFWIIASLFRASLSGIDEIRDRPHGIVMTGLLAGLSGFLIHSFVDVNIFTLQLGNLMWFVMGLVIAARNTACGSGFAPAESPQAAA